MHFLCAAEDHSKQSHRWHPSPPSLFCHYICRKRWRFSICKVAEGRKSAIVAEISVTWSQLSAGRWSVWNGCWTLTQTAGTGRRTVVLKVKASQIIYHMRLSWQLSDKVTRRSPCYVCCFGVNFWDFWRRTACGKCSLGWLFLHFSPFKSICILRSYLPAFERFLLMAVAVLFVWPLSVVMTNTRKCILSIPEARQRLTSLLHFWDAMGAFVQANPGTVVMSVLV